jgi:hypothetical protein
LFRLPLQITGIAVFRGAVAVLNRTASDGRVRALAFAERGLAHGVLILAAPFDLA